MRPRGRSDGPWVRCFPDTPAVHWVNAVVDVWAWVGLVSGGSGIVIPPSALGWVAGLRVDLVGALVGSGFCCFRSLGAG